MKQTNRQTCRGIGWGPLPWIIVLCIGGAAQPQDSAVSVPWHEKNAVLRFRIEKDNTHSLVPNVSVFELEPGKKSADVKKWAQKNRWSDKRRIQGQLCQDFLPTFGTRAIIYDLHRDFTHFVGRAAIVDGGDPNASVDFSVHADKRLIFRSGPLTREKPVAEIHAGIPGRSKQLKLTVEAPNKNYLRWAKWLDPGFLLR
ncbi:MAG: NPCBM/NEW2 domain-containing protein, partial [Phycisphaerales bacterium]